MPLPPLPALVIDFTICETILNCLSSAFTSWVEVPLPCGDPEPPRPVDHRGPAPLLGGHRADDRLDAAELRLVDLGLAQLLRHARQHRDQVLQRPHLPHLAHLLEEVLEREVALAQLLRSARGLVGVERLLGLLDEAEHVAHAEDPARHAVGIEGLEVLELLTDTDEEDRAAGDLLHRQRGTAARVAVELREHHAGEVDRLRERLGDVHRFLTGHRVDDEQRVVGLHGLADTQQLVHEVGVDLQPARGVDDHDVAAEPVCLVDARLARPRPGRCRLT